MFTFLQRAHAGDAHAMDATVLMDGVVGWLCSRSVNVHTLVMHTRMPQNICCELWDKARLLSGPNHMDTLYLSHSERTNPKNS